MLKIKKGLSNILESNNNEPGEAPQPPQPQTPQIHTALKLNEPEEVPQPPQLHQSAEPAVQPPAPAPRRVARQVGDQVEWEEHLMQALAKAPDDVAQKLASCIDREVLLKVLEKRDDPYLKVALLLLTKK
jgi:hypothetical protein